MGKIKKSPKSLKDKYMDELNRRIPRTYTIRRNNAIFAANFANENFVSISKMMEFFLDKVIMKEEYGEQIVDDCVRYSLPKKYHI